jgi:hypothetical protein
VGGGWVNTTLGVEVGEMVVAVVAVDVVVGATITPGPGPVPGEWPRTMISTTTTAATAATAANGASSRTPNLCACAGDAR